jgi:glycosyltransferase involved in cell wall biosynthesis
MTRPLNVLHVVANLCGGGVERLLVESLAVLDHDNFTHQVCCVSSGGIYEKDLRRLGIPYWIMKRRLRFDPTVILQMVHLMRREHIDVMHGLNFTGNAWGRLAAKLAGVPRIIAHERGTAWTENAIMRWVDRRLYPFTHLWLANSEASAIMLTQRIGIPAEHIRVVHNGLPEYSPSRQTGSPLRERIAVDSDIPLIGTVGRLDTPKGHIFLLRAIPLVWQVSPQAHFVIIGDGPLRHLLETEARRMGLLNEGRVHFLGFVEGAAYLMQDLDILVHPAIRESLGNVLIEAGLACLPVIACNVDGCSEVIVDGETGVLVDCTMPVEYMSAPGASPMPKVIVDGNTRTLREPLSPSPGALSDAILSLLRDPQLRRKMGKRGRERARQIFSLNRYTQTLERAYRGNL